MLLLKLILLLLAEEAKLPGPVTLLVSGAGLENEKCLINLAPLNNISKILVFSD